MTYQEAMDFIHSIQRFGSKPGLRRVKLLLERMGNPQEKLRFIHVAGTNGKGSTCTMLSYVLARAGYRTGLYISPYVVDFRERIQLGNEMIPEADLAACTTVVWEHWKALEAMGEPPTEFEVVVAVAMEYFVRKRCDVVVLEVGMGGRFDATNVIDNPLCSVICSIGVDHTEYLGGTLEEIAGEKAGIIKPGCPVVCSPGQEPEALAVIMERSAQCQSPLVIPNMAGMEVLEQTIRGSRFRWGDQELELPLAGAHQLRNCATVLETLEVVSRKGLGVSARDIREGLAQTKFPSRLEIVREEPLVLLDGAHNLAGARALAGSLDLLHGRRVHAVVGMLQDKDVNGVLGIVLSKCASLTAVTPDSPRAMPAAELAERARPFIQDIEVAENLRQAVLGAMDRCTGSAAVLIFGSLYLASAVRPILLKLSNSV